jgi:hypothetical protein
MVCAMARPTKFKREFCEKARALCERGATDIELADAFDVSLATIYRWRNSEPQFCEAVIAGKSAADDRVFQFQGQIVRAETREHVPPDPGAAFNWLKNRRGEQWRDKREIEHGVTNDLADRMMRYRERASG